MNNNIRLFAPDDEPARSHSGLTVAEVIRRYLIHMLDRAARGDYGKAGLYNARHDLNRFAASYGEQLVSECRQADLTRWLEANPQWKAACTKKRACGIVVNCFAWAADEDQGLIDVNPYRRPSCLRGLVEEVRRPALVAEYVMLMRFGSRCLRRALFFLRRTGARTCEMRELRWTDLHLTRRAPYILLDRHKTRKTTGQIRKIGLDPGVARFLANLQKQAPHGQTHVFVNRDGNPWCRHVFARHLRRYAKRLGLDDGVDKPVSAYCFRHSYTVAAIEAGIGERQIADQLGHAKTDKIGLIYGRHTRQHEEHLARVAAEIQRKRLKEGAGDAD